MFVKIRESKENRRFEIFKSFVKIRESKENCRFEIFKSFVKVRESKENRRFEIFFLKMMIAFHFHYAHRKSTKMIVNLR